MQTKMMEWQRWAEAKISEENPTIMPYIGSDDPMERMMAKWHRSIQGKYRRGTLNDMEIMTLENLPGWTWGKDRDSEFGKKVQKWSCFYRLHGRPPRNNSTASKEEKACATWATRVQHQKKTGKLAEHYIMVLDKTHGWMWREPARSTTFEERLQAWNEFFVRTGRVPVREDGDIYQWRSRMLNNYANNKLSNERIQLLSALPGWNWDEEPEHMRTGKKWVMWVRLNENTLPSPSSTTNPLETRLGEWAYAMRAAIQNNQVPEEVKRDLMSLPLLKIFLENN